MTKNYEYLIAVMQPSIEEILREDFNYKEYVSKYIQDIKFYNETGIYKGYLTGCENIDFGISPEKKELSHEPTQREKRNEFLRSQYDREIQELMCIAKDYIKKDKIDLINDKITLAMKNLTDEYIIAQNDNTEMDNLEDFYDKYQKNLDEQSKKMEEIILKQEEQEKLKKIELEQEKQQRLAQYEIDHKLGNLHFSDICALPGLQPREFELLNRKIRSVIPNEMWENDEYDIYNMTLRDICLLIDSSEEILKPSIEDKKTR